MSDDLSTVWPAEPHTLAKHALLKSYLEAWMPIMARQKAKLGDNRRELLYVDGFAGPGVYQGGEDGSPVIAIKAALAHQATFPHPIRFIFIELDDKRYPILKGIIDRYQRMDSPKVQIDTPIHGDCESKLSAILARHEKSGTKFGPALVFLDQFGYSTVPMDLIAQIMKYPSCEVFSYLEYKNLNRFITDSKKHGGIDRAFGGTEWREAIHLPQGERDEFLLRKYKEALSSRGGASYVSNFSMYDSKGQLLYWLFFSTGNLRGLEEMKKAMWSVDKGGSFRFSDRIGAGQEPLFLNGGFTQEWLAETCSKELHDRTMILQEVKEYVLTQTPCIHFKEALSLLERGKRLDVLNASELGRKTGFSDEYVGRMKVHFVRPPQREKQESLFGGF